ncbi:MAG: hypothetical protein Q4D40_04420 [Eubacteriales bacterium]|nr:hypothetical protein [Eubacteriales bacterium]
MSTKALKTQLMAAIAMVLVAALALGSSTYAWFAQNTKVTADSMTLSAQTAANLSISKTSATAGFGTSIAFDNASKGAAIVPVTMTAKIDAAYAAIGTAGTQTKIDGEEIKFYKIDNDNNVQDPSVTTADHPISTQLQTDGSVTDYFTEDTGLDNVLKNTFWVKYDAEAGTTKAVKLTLTVKDADSTGTAINNAFHMGILVYGATTADNKFYNYDMSATTPAAGVYTFNADSFVTLTSGTPVKMDVFAWYEGEDEHCTTVNAVAVDALQAGITFETMS